MGDAVTSSSCLPNCTQACDSCDIHPSMFAGVLSGALILTNFCSVLLTCWYMRRSTSGGQGEKQVQSPIYDTPPDARFDGGSSSRQALSPRRPIPLSHMNKNCLNIMETNSPSTNQMGFPNNPQEQGTSRKQYTYDCVIEATSESSQHPENDDSLEDAHGYVIMNQSTQTLTEPKKVTPSFQPPSLPLQNGADPTSSFSLIETNPPTAPPTNHNYETTLLQGVAKEPTNFKNDSSIPPPLKPKPLHLRPPSDTSKP